MSAEQQFGLFVMITAICVAFLGVSGLGRHEGYIDGYKVGYADAKSGNCDHEYFKECQTK